MHVVIAPDGFADGFAGALTATQAATAIAAGWSAAAPHDVLTQVPLSDGGPGFLDVLARGLGGEMLATTVADPLGRPVPASILLVPAADGEGGPTAYVEAAQAAGLHLLDASERDPTATSTYGVGELLRTARDAGARRIVVGLGGGGTNDAGAGMLAALGAGGTDGSADGGAARGGLARGGLALAALGPDELGGLRATIADWRGIEIIAATEIENPLLGLQGASATFAVAMGASPVQAQALEGALGHFADRVWGHVPPRTDLLTGKPMRLDKEPGAGAGGGLGFGLFLLGGRRRSGVDIVLDALGVADLIAAADLVVTGSGRIDWQSLRGGVVAGVAAAGLACATPTILLGGQVHIGRREAMSIGLSGAYAVATTPAEEEAAFADPVGTVQARAARVAATWSPGPR